MKCPLLMYNYLPDENPTEGKRVDCVKEECAWWYFRIGCCSVVVLSMEAKLLSATTTLLLAKVGKGDTK